MLLSKRVIAVLFLILLGAAIALVTKTRLFSSQDTSTANSSYLLLADKKVSVEIANSPAKQQRGLSGRDGLSENSGMLFAFGEPKSSPAFWMKDMRFAIDIIWIADDKIAGIDKNVPPPAAGAKLEQLQLYYPPEPINYVLEVEAGFCDKNTIQVGDTVDFGNV